MRMLLQACHGDQMTRALCLESDGAHRQYMAV